MFLRKKYFSFFLVLTAIIIFIFLFKQIRKNNLRSTMKLYYNAIVYSYDSKIKKSFFHEAIVVKDGKIAFVGSFKEAKNKFKKFDKEIDLKGNLVLPGFIDSHTHMIWGGLSLRRLDLRNCKSKEEFISKIKLYAEQNPEVYWILGGNWDHEDFETPELPSKEWIDQTVKDRPVFLTRIDLHMGVANSKALELAGISANTQVPDGGEILKDKNGQPTGILKDKAIDFIDKVIPKPNFKEFDEALDTAQNYALANGVVAVFDVTQKEEIEVFKEFDRKEKLKVKVFARVPIEYFYEKRIEDVAKRFNGKMFKILALKAFADGSLGSSTAYFFDSYEDKTDYYGLPMDILSDGKLEDMTLKGIKNGWKISIHAIGDRANYEVLKIYENAAGLPEFLNKKHMIEHCQHLREEDIIKFSNLNVIASVQPYHLFDDGAWAEKKIGKRRARYTYAFKSLLNIGAIVAGGSDWPVVDLNPLLGIYSAVTRQTSCGKYLNGWIPEEKISVEEAVLMYTYNAALALEMENELGTIEQGKAADFAVLDKNIFEINPESIKETKVLMTVINGNVVFDKIFIP